MNTQAVVRPSSPGYVPMPRASIKLSWGAIIGGLIVTLGVWLLLTVLGLAVGLSAIDPNDPSSIKAAGMTTGIWSIIVPLVALFVGGLVAARTAGIVDRATGAIHGLVLWALATLATVFLVGMMATSAVGLAGGALGAAVRGGGEVGQSAVPALGIDANDLVGPLNERLRAEGRPTVTAQELDNAVKSAARTSIREGRLDRQVFESSLAANTRLSPADTRELSDRVQAQLQTQGANIEHGALQAADTTGKALWWVFLGMVVSLVTAIAGATLGVTRRQRLAASAVTAEAAAIPLGTPHEVHP